MDVLFWGDFFCAMQGRKDPRHRKSDVKRQNMVDSYYDSLVDDAVELLAPYAPHIWGIGYGNHETSILDHAETDLIARTITQLNHLPNAKIQRLGYGGWIQFKLSHEAGGNSNVINVAYTHGYGGEAPKTKGVLQTGTRSTIMPDAHVIFSGHIHQSFAVEDVRDRITRDGKLYKDTLLHIQLPTYKDEYDQTHGLSWHRQKGKTPRPQGAWWLRLEQVNRKVEERHRSIVTYSARRAL